MTDDQRTGEETVSVVVNLNFLGTPVGLLYSVVWTTLCRQRQWTA